MNLTNRDAQLMKDQHGIVVGYNTQAMVLPRDPAGAGARWLLTTAADVANTADDYGQLAPMLEEAKEITEVRVPITLADGGYHTGANLEARQQRQQRVVMPEGQREATKFPYFKDRFQYAVASDSYVCPHGQRLAFRGTRPHKGGAIRIYGTSGAICRTCPAFGACTKDRRWQRALWIGPHDALLHRRRQWMGAEEARSLYALRKELNEPTFGTLKEQMGTRRLLRGPANVKAEFVLLATEFNYEEVLCGGRGQQTYLTPEEKPTWSPYWTRDVGIGEYPNACYFYRPRLCNCCFRSACADVCPHGSIYKREEDRVVLAEEDR